MERLGVGINVMLDPTPEHLVDSINKIMSPNPDGQLNQYQRASLRLQKMIEFKELRSGFDLSYLLRRMSNYHIWSGREYSKHLSHQLESVYDNTFVTTYDYDLKIGCVALMVTAVFYFKNVICK
jgi:hypothetical protein